MFIHRSGQIKQAAKLGFSFMTMSLDFSSGTSKLIIKLQTHTTQLQQNKQVTCTCSCLNCLNLAVSFDLEQFYITCVYYLLLCKKGMPNLN